MDMPMMTEADGIVQHRRIEFLGYDHNLLAGEGAVYDMENITGDRLPLLTVRPPRCHMLSIPHPGSLYADDRLFWVSDHCLYEKTAGKLLSGLSTNHPGFATLGHYLILLPDLLYCRPVPQGPQGSPGWETGSLANHFNQNLDPDREAVYHLQNPIPGETAAAAVLELPTANHGFRVGDGVQIRVFSRSPSRHQVIDAVIRQVDGTKLGFYENSFARLLGDAQSVTLPTAISRSVPDLDFICVNENRLWGCKGDKLYGSKLGDPFNFNCFDGLSTDSFALETGSPGAFTACVSFQGYPLFFKEDQIFKLYGSKPENFQLLSFTALGVQAGSAKSLAVAGEQLFYLSRAGVMCYSGGAVQPMNQVFGEIRYHGGVGGSDGSKYYLSMLDAGNRAHLFFYDTLKRQWYRQDDTRALGFGYHGGFYCLGDTGDLWLLGEAPAESSPAPPFGNPRPELPEEVESFIEFADFYEGGPNHFATSKLLIRIEVPEGAAVTVSLQYDSDGIWHDAARLTPARKKSYYLPIIPRRCDHYRIRLRGKGRWQLFSLVRESYTGSPLH